MGKRVCFTEYEELFSWPVPFYGKLNEENNKRAAGKNKEMNDFNLKICIFAM